MGTYSSVFCLCLGLRFLSLSGEADELIRRLLARRTNKSGDFVVVVVGSKEVECEVASFVSVEVTGATVVEVRLDSGGLVRTGDCRGLVGFDRGELYYVRHAWLD